MKRAVSTIIIILLFSSLALAQDSNLYLQNQLELQLDVKGEFELVPKNGASKTNRVTAELFLFPFDDIRQTVLKNSEKIINNRITYQWSDQRLGTQTFSYTAKIKTKNLRQKVTKSIPFPIKERDLTGYETYLQPTETIDSSHHQIIAKAAELAEGETDLFKVAFNLADWVERNVKYDLNSLTAQASQKASWVLENRQGVCDEMTSLFIAMARSLGIPARFVKGISHTNSALFSNPWQAHGWAEVYFPEIGWVSFDVTFGEFGYIDVTHIKLKDGLDPQEPDTKYEWVSNGVNLITRPLDLQVKVLREGELLQEEVELKQEILSKEVSFGSYNLIKGVLTNNADYYIATTLQLAVPNEISIVDRNRRTILLAPKSERETFWIINIPDDLSLGYIYNFPSIIYSEKNVSIRDEFSSQEGKASYSLSEIRELTVQDEEKVYSRLVQFSCNEPDPIKLGQKTTINCRVKNTGNTNLDIVNLCLAKECENINLLINQEIIKEIEVTGAVPGWNKILISAENEFIEKKSSIEFAVLDDPEINLEVDAPEILHLDSKEQIIINIGKKSFSSPKNLEVTIKGLGIKNIWEISDLNQPEKILISAESLRIASKNKLKLSAKWNDDYGESFSLVEEIIILGEGSQLRLLLNSILNFF